MCVVIGAFFASDTEASAVCLSSTFAYLSSTAMVDNIGALVRRSSMGNPHEELEMLEVLGEGAYGAVRKARRRRDGQVYS
jgi:hypothetical protein